MANQLFAVESAKVIKVGQYTFGNGNNGPWAKINVKVEVEQSWQEANGETKTRRSGLVLTFWNEKAKWAKDNIKAGNPYADEPVPDMYLNAWFSTKGDINERTNGGEFVDISANVEFCEICK